MTVTSEIRDVSFIGNGIQQQFIFPFVSYDTDWIAGYVDGVLDETAVVELNEDQNDSPGGTVTFTLIPGVDTDVFIERTVDLLQETHYPAFSPFPSRDHEQALDKLTMIAQQDKTEFEGKVNRAGDEMLGELSMGGQPLTNLPDGVDPQDATNVGQIEPFVDRAESAAIGAEASESAAADSAQSATDEADRAESEADRAEAAAVAGSAAVGELKWYFTDHTDPIIRPGMIIPNGQLVDKLGVFNALWLSVDLGNQIVVDEADWQAGQKAAFVDYDTDQFRLPLIEGQFIRVPGALDPDFGTRLPGDTQLDAVGPLDVTDPLHSHGSGALATSMTGAHTHGRGTDTAYVRTTADTGFVLRNVINIASGAVSINTDQQPNHSHDVTGSTNTNATGVTVEGEQSADETRAINIYLQPYIVYASSPSGTGITLRGAWDADTNTVSGDALNLTLTKGVAPTVESGNPNGQGYVVTTAGSFDLTNTPGAETYVIGDRVAWADTTWVQVKTGEVSSVNLQTGDVLLGGDILPIEVADPVGPTIKEYIDTRPFDENLLINSGCFVWDEGVVRSLVGLGGGVDGAPYAAANQIIIAVDGAATTATIQRIQTVADGRVAYASSVASDTTAGGATHIGVSMPAKADKWETGDKTFSATFLNNVAGGSRLIEMRIVSTLQDRSDELILVDWEEMGTVPAGDNQIRLSHTVTVVEAPTAERVNLVQFRFPADDFDGNPFTWTNLQLTNTAYEVPYVPQTEAEMTLETLPFYEKSYDPDVEPGFSTNAGCHRAMFMSGQTIQASMAGVALTTAISMTTKAKAATIQLFSTTAPAGNAATPLGYTGGGLAGNIPIGAETLGRSGFSVRYTSVAQADIALIVAGYQFQWSADARF